MQKKKFFILTIALLIVFVLAGCGKNDETKTNSKTDNNSAEEAMNASGEMVSNEEVEGYEPVEMAGLPQTYSQNNFTIILERIALAEDRTIATFKIKNDRAVEVKLNFQPVFNPAYIVQRDRKFESKGNPRHGFQYRSGKKEVDIEVFFPPLPYRDVATLFVGGPSSDFLVDDTDWQDIEFKIDLAGENIVDKKKYYQNKEYAKYLYEYGEHGIAGGKDLEKVDGHSLYYRIISIIPEEEIIFSVGYLDNDNQWHEVKRYERYDDEKTWKQGDKMRYPGKFTKKDDANYKDICDTGISIYGLPIKLSGGNYCFCEINGIKYTYSPFFSNENPIIIDD